jgi:hypothetical protein
MNTSPWGNPAPIEIQDEADTPFYFEVGSEDDKFDFVCTSADLKDMVIASVLPYMALSKLSASDILIFTYREEIDEIAINPEIPAGYFRLFHVGSKTDFKEFKIHEKKVV